MRIIAVIIALVISQNSHNIPINAHAVCDMQNIEDAVVGLLELNKALVIDRPANMDLVYVNTAALEWRMVKVQYEPCDPVINEGMLLADDLLITSMIYVNTSILLDDPEIEEIATLMLEDNTVMLEEWLLDDFEAWLSDL